MDTDTLWNAPIEDLKKGYARGEEGFVCLFCGRFVEQGLIYPEEGRFYEAETYMRRHIGQAHGSPFEALIALDKKATGLTDHQNALLRLFYEGRSDDEVKSELGIGSASTIRNHRFALKEKERQARLFLALMELLKERGGDRTTAFIAPHPQARLMDDRYNLTEDEEREILRNAFPDGPDGPLRTFDLQEKQRLAVLRHLASRLDDERAYTEKEINAALEPFYADYAILRRFLIEYGFVEREPDGSAYWTTRGGRPNARAENRQADHPDHDQQANPKPNCRAAASLPPKEESSVNPTNRRKELQALYKEMKQEGGVYRIVHKDSGRSFIASLPNLKSMDGRRFELNNGSFKNKELQRDWKEYGEEAFEFEILEVLKPSDNAYVTVREQLGELEQKWMDELEPYGERGYHRRSSK
ncbi:transcriptional regulator [Saccharibacillus sp. O23]|uniref:DUF2087 domain-containing protein n=1 Tax=Saccharibacillus sp. O23 TaxID=2009338 RepID=UPI000B4E4424|nr:DUF2087 domain-containing protein [Saccharibacillus sp. O23]OWR26738.1 transcriptional regulator [Saccharibacillus sp. O23]